MRQQTDNDHDRLLDKKTHSLSIYNRADIENSKWVGCFFCINIYDPSKIEEWTDGGRTALCPKCSIDSVLPDSKIDITKEFLSKMCERWFCEIVAERKAVVTHKEI